MGRPSVVTSVYIIPQVATLCLILQHLPRRFIGIGEASKRCTGLSCHLVEENRIALA